MVAAAARGTPVARGAPAAVRVLCLLALVVDASVLGRLRARTGTDGPSRLRVALPPR